MADENNQIAHFGILQSTFWRQNPRPPLPINALDLLDPMNTFSSHQAGYRHCRSSLGLTISKLKISYKHCNVYHRILTQTSIAQSRSCERTMSTVNLSLMPTYSPSSCNICKRSFTLKLGYSFLQFHKLLSSSSVMIKTYSCPLRTLCVIRAPH